jgi:hypothetical protein
VDDTEAGVEVEGGLGNGAIVDADRLGFWRLRNHYFWFSNLLSHNNHLFNRSYIGQVLPPRIHNCAWLIIGIEHVLVLTPTLRSLHNLQMPRKLQRNIGTLPPRRARHPIITPRLLPTPSLPNLHHPVSLLAPRRLWFFRYESDDFLRVEPRLLLLDLLGGGDLFAEDDVQLADLLVQFGCGSGERGGGLWGEAGLGFGVVLGHPVDEVVLDYSGWEGPTLWIFSLDTTIGDDCF